MYYFSLAAVALGHSHLNSPLEMVLGAPAARRGKERDWLLEWFASRCTCGIYIHLLLIFPFFLKVPDMSSCFWALYIQCPWSRRRRADWVDSYRYGWGKKKNLIFIFQGTDAFRFQVYMYVIPLGGTAWWQNDQNPRRWMLSWGWLENVLIALGPSFQVE